jgi:hypothetical protein
MFHSLPLGRVAGGPVHEALPSGKRFEGESCF